jgi:hypothetical protein
MKVICSWCKAEGKPALVREKEPLENPEDTHGVCKEHKGLLGTADSSVASSDRARKAVGERGRS